MSEDEFEPTCPDLRGLGESRVPHRLRNWMRDNFKTFFEYFSRKRDEQLRIVKGEVVAEVKSTQQDYSEEIGDLITKLISEREEVLKAEQSLQETEDRVREEAGLIRGQMEALDKRGREIQEYIHKRIKTIRNFGYVLLGMGIAGAIGLGGCGVKMVRKNIAISQEISRTEVGALRQELDDFHKRFRDYSETQEGKRAELERRVGELQDENGELRKAQEQYLTKTAQRVEEAQAQLRGEYSVKISEVEKQLEAIVVEESKRKEEIAQFDARVGEVNSALNSQGERTRVNLNLVYLDLNSLRREAAQRMDLLELKLLATMPYRYPETEPEINLKLSEHGKLSLQLPNY